MTHPAYRIECQSDTETARYAARELAHFLQKYSNGTVQPGSNFGEATLYALSLDPALDAHQFRLRGQAGAVQLTGGSPSALLNAVYTALARAGIAFDTEGDECAAFRPEALAGIDELVAPFCRQRGVRQHINFPMDISSYALADAKEYVRRLARMGMNALTFHSYTGQWHGVPAQGIHAGHFFYGQVHEVPPELSACVDNRVLYSIPEIEPILYDEPARDAWARYWLREVIDAARTAGMAVTLSVELLPRETASSESDDSATEKDITAQIEMLRALLDSYPQIDMLEIVTPEGGGQGDALTLAELPSRAAALFGVSRLPYLPASLPDALPGALTNVHRALAVFARRSELTEKPMALGMYVMCRETVKTLNGILEQVLPPDTVRTVLPAHGAMAVRDNVAFFDLSAQGWQHTLLYSWAEFDGNMYLLQNSAPGIEALLMLGKDAQPEGIHGLCLNHWRTAENAVALAYAAASMIAPVSARAFYAQYAAGCGIADTQRFADAMEALGELDTFTRDHLFNIGFCYLGCWMNPGLSWVRVWEDASMARALAEFERLADELTACLGGALHAKGRRLLRLLINRAQCSALQIRAIRPLKALSEFTRDDTPGALHGAEKERALALCAEAEAYSRQYLEMHTACMPDRGCQGTAVSYAATIGVYIRHIRECFIEGAAECTHNPPDFDAPPPPNAAFLR